MQWRAIFEGDLVSNGVDVDRRREDHARTRSPGQRDDFDFELRESIVAGDEAGHHAGIDCNGSIDDDHQPKVFGPIHRESTKHLDVAMAAAYEHDGARRAGVQVQSFSLAVSL